MRHRRTIEQDEPWGGMPNGNTDWDTSKQLTQAYDAAKATFTILVGVLGAGAAADVALVGSVFKDGIVDASSTALPTIKLGACFALILAGILVLVVVKGVVYLGKSLAATAVTILAIERKAGVKAFASVARNILAAGYGADEFERLQRAATELAERRAIPAAEGEPAVAAGADETSTIQIAAETPLFRGGLVIAGRVIGWTQVVGGVAGIFWNHLHPVIRVSA